MWITLLVMAVAVSLEPFRIGMTLLLLNRPRAALQLPAFLVGGFLMGVTVGLVVLFVLRPAIGSAHFTLPRVQMVVGAVVLVNAALVATGVLGTMRGDRPPGALETRARRLLDGRSLWTAGIALPSVDDVAALALVVASGATAATQIGALLLFNVVGRGCDDSRCGADSTAGLRLGPGGVRGQGTDPRRQRRCRPGGDPDGSAARRHRVRDGQHL